MRPVQRHFSAENTAEGSDDLSTAVQMTEIIGLPDASHLI